MMENENGAAESCCELLTQGLAVIEGLTADQYYCAETEGRSCPGAHFRHVLDYYDCFFRGIGTGSIDYAQRVRRSEVEHDRQAGVAEMRRIIEALEKLGPDDLDLTLKVRSDSGESWCGSTLARELRFIAGHTVHHYALIQMILERAGIETDADYGVSRSTQIHRAAPDTSDLPVDEDVLRSAR